MNKTAKDTYTATATHTLAGFQLLEAILKDYIGEYYDTLRDIIGDKLVFKHERKDIENSPLGRSCTIFSKLNDNADILSKIQLIQKHRDDLAHRALTHIYDTTVTDEEYIKLSDEYDCTIKEIDEVMELIHLESEKLGNNVKENQ